MEERRDRDDDGYVERNNKFTENGCPHRGTSVILRWDFGTKVENYCPKCRYNWTVITAK